MEIVSHVFVCSNVSRISFENILCSFKIKRISYNEKKWYDNNLRIKR